MFRQSSCFILRLIIIFSVLPGTVSAVQAESKITARDELTKQKLKNPVVTSLGQKLTAAEINQMSITIFPDGTNLPLGSGTVSEGKKLYLNRCQNCHGEDGDEGPAARLTGSDGWGSLSDPLRILRIKKYPILLISVGSLWPYSTSIFDYIRRAMPHFLPKSLTNNEVYAITAYILYLNDLIDSDVTLNKDNIVKVTMPGKARSVSVWEK